MATNSEANSSLQRRNDMVTTVGKTPKERICDADLLLSKKHLFEKLYNDVYQFLQIANETLQLSQSAKLKREKKLSLTLGLNAKVTQWRAKRKGNKLFSNFDQILTTIEEMQNRLTTYVDSCVVASTILNQESQDYRKQLYSCKLFNELLLEKSNPDLIHTSDALSSIQNIEREVKFMLEFCDEVKAHGDLQDEAKEREREEALLQEEKRKAMYVSWAMREMDQSDEDSEIDEDPLVKSDPVNRGQIEKKLKKIEKIHNRVARHMEALTEDSDVHRSRWEASTKLIRGIDILSFKVKNVKISEDVIRKSKQTQSQRSPLNLGDEGKSPDKFTTSSDDNKISVDVDKIESIRQRSRRKSCNDSRADSTGGLSISPTRTLTVTSFRIGMGSDKKVKTPLFDRLRKLSVKIGKNKGGKSSRDIELSAGGTSLDAIHSYDDDIEEGDDGNEKGRYGGNEGDEFDDDEEDEDRYSSLWVDRDSEVDIHISSTIDQTGSVREEIGDKSSIFDDTEEKDKMSEKEIEEEEEKETSTETGIGVENDSTPPHADADEANADQIVHNSETLDHALCKGCEGVCDLCKGCLNLLETCLKMTERLDSKRKKLALLRDKMNTVAEELEIYDWGSLSNSSIAR